jgi:hypothetical protein
MSQPQPRSATASRMVAKTPTAGMWKLDHKGNKTNGVSIATWGTAGLPAPTQQARDAVAPDSWAQAMGGSRTNTQLDLSASSFPSLNNNGHAQNQSIASSPWQTGPPPNEPSQRQQMPTSRHLPSRQQQPSGGRDGFYPSDTYSRNAPMEFASDASSQPVRRPSQAPSGPPGLARPMNQQGESTSADPSRVTSPSGQTQICRYWCPSG